MKRFNENQSNISFNGSTIPEFTDWLNYVISLQKSSLSNKDIHEALIGVTKLVGSGTDTFTNTYVPFGDTDGSLTEDSLFVYDTVNKRLGVGLSNPSTRLDVVGDFKLTGNTAMTGGVTGFLTANYQLFTPGFSPLFVIDPATLHVGMGTAVPSAMLHVNGDVRFEDFNASTLLMTEGLTGGTYTRPSTIPFFSDEGIMTEDNLFRVATGNTIPILGIGYDNTELEALRTLSGASLFAVQDDQGQKPYVHFVSQGMSLGVAEAGNAFKATVNSYGGLDKYTGTRANWYRQQANDGFFTLGFRPEGSAFPLERLSLNVLTDEDGQDFLDVAISQGNVALTGANELFRLKGKDGTLRIGKYGAGTKDAVTLGVTASAYLAGYATDGTFIEIDSSTLDNLYNTNGELNSIRDVDLRTFDLTFRRGAAASEIDMLALDASSGRVCVGGSTSEAFGILHVKSQGAGDGQIIVAADETNALIMRLLNSGTFRLDNYGQGNKTAVALTKTYTNKAIIAPADDGTFIEIEHPFPYSAWITSAETANVNDWAPTGFEDALVLARTGAGAINITGLDATGAIQGTERQIHNRGTGVITLTDFDVLSVITNRFKTPAAAGSAISVDGIATLIYNGTNWFIKSIT